MISDDSLAAMVGAGVELARARELLETSGGDLNAAMDAHFAAHGEGNEEENGDDNDDEADEEDDEADSSGAPPDDAVRAADSILARAEKVSSTGDAVESKWSTLGGGARLGSADAAQRVDADTEDAAQARGSAVAPEAAEPHLEVRVTFFADGFTVDEDVDGPLAPAPRAQQQVRRTGIATLGDSGDSGGARGGGGARPRRPFPTLRRFEDPQSRAFLAYLERNEVPPDLRRLGANGAVRRVRFGVADARPMRCPWADKAGVARLLGQDDDNDVGQDDDQDSPQTHVGGEGGGSHFAGAGQTLGGGAQGENGAAAACAPWAALAADDGFAAPVVDESQPKTTLQLRLADGRRVRATLNLAHTVRHLRAIVRENGGAASGRPYLLIAGFPPAPLHDLDASIQAAGLSGAAVSQRLC